ncbi:TonB-dependent siderophore receptor [Steroidobacter flavus]|uniref:TonB-dependent siderophore receptor n=1 Tax=Steroidobacter flavus TaxID=1842136 RepID=A0ABV8T4U2_9GAMM
MKYLIRMLVAATTCAASIVPATQVRAQTVQASSEGALEFNIPAQPLNVALRTFAEFTGLQLVYSSALVTDIKSSGLKGRYRVEQALQLMLSGTGLAYRLGSGNTAIIEKVTAGNSRVLGPVRVEGADSGNRQVPGTNGSRDRTATEGTGSYTSDALTVGSKSPQSMKDTTQSVSVITAERMKDQNLTDFNEVLRQSTGITLVQGDGEGTTGTNLENSFYSRGFLVRSIQIDGGAPLVSNFGFYPQIDMSQYDHVEVLRGAAGLFNGYGDPSGTVNLVRKKPLDHNQVLWEGQAGSWNTYRSMLDVTGPIAAFDGALRGRLVVTYQDNEYFYDMAKDSKSLIYGVVDYDLTPSTLLTAGFSNAEQDSVPWRFGLPRYQNGDDLKLSRSTSLMFPWNRWDFDTTQLFVTVDQRLGADWAVKLNVTHSSQESRQKVGYSTGTVNPLTGLGPSTLALMNDYTNEQILGELTLSGAFEWFGQRQELVVGINHADNDGGGATNFPTLMTGTAALPYVPFPNGPRFCSGTTTACPNGTSPAVNVFAFNPFDILYTEPQSVPPSQRRPAQGEQKSGAYLNLRLTAWERFHLTTGVRYSEYEYTNDILAYCTSLTQFGCTTPGMQIGDLRSASHTQYKDDDLTWPPAAVLSYDLADTLTLHFGYTDIHISQADSLTGDLQPIEPITGSNIELSAKWQSADGRLDANVAVYRIEQSGFAVRDLSRRVIEFDPARNQNVTYYVANDGQRFEGGDVDDQHSCCWIADPNRTLKSRGVDAEITGELAAGWQLFTGYTYNKNKRTGSYYRTDDGTPIVSRQPEHLLKLWTTYDFAAAGAGGHGWLSRLSLSGGVNWQSKAYQAGTACTQLGAPNNFGVSNCLVTTPYSFTQQPYAIWSTRIDYELNDTWRIALNADNLTDTRYYQTMGTSLSGNWYGAPMSYTLTLRGHF